MPPYELDDSSFQDLCRSKKLSTGEEAVLRQKIEKIRCIENPRSLGGAYHGKWGYPVGNFHIICHIDDDARVVSIRALVSLG